jgi:glycosyltransferase involved in cell wall biosynthesis
MIGKDAGHTSRSPGRPQRISKHASLEHKILKNLRRARKRALRLGKLSKRAFLKRWPRSFEDLVIVKRVRGWRVHLSVKHLHGPKKIAYALDELVVVCIVRNGRPYMKSFIDHYLSLGVKHIVFLDNGSDDDTVAFARDHGQVTVIQSRLPYKKYEGAMIQYLLSRFGMSRWSLYVDIDELFDYPYSDVVSLSSLLRYLNEKSYTAVVTQVLDMFPDRALSSRVSQKDEPLKELYRFYDLSNVKNNDYKSRSNVIANDDIKRLRDGIRTTLFDVPFALTNHRLIFFDGEVRPAASGRGLHRVENARLADLSCVLYHYKLVDGFREWAARAVREESYNPELMRRHYKKYLEVVKRNPGIRIRQATARELGSVNDLVDNGFLVVSEDYRKWAGTDKETRDAQR